jgi:hypothetical protein
VKVTAARKSQRLWEQEQVNTRVFIYGADFFFLDAAFFAAGFSDGRL